MALLCLFITHFGLAQQFSLPHVAANDRTSVDRQMNLLAADVMKTYGDKTKKDFLENEFKLQLLNGKYQGSLEMLSALNSVSVLVSPYKIPSYLAHELFVKTKMAQPSDSAAFEKTYTTLFNTTFEKLDDRSAYRGYGSFPNYYGIDVLKDRFQNDLSAAQKKDKLTATEALSLCTSYYDLLFSQQTAAIARSLIVADCNRRYTFKSQLISIPNGIHINVITALKKGITRPLPAALEYTIYADSTDIRLFAPAAYGYAAVTAYSRGKGLSPDEIVPYEHDGKDANAIITWIPTRCSAPMSSC